MVPVQKAPEDEIVGENGQSLNVYILELIPTSHPFSLPPPPTVCTPRSPSPLPSSVCFITCVAPPAAALLLRCRRRRRRRRARWSWRSAVSGSCWDEPPTATSRTPSRPSWCKTRRTHLILFFTDLFSVWDVVVVFFRFVKCRKRCVSVFLP